MPETRVERIVFVLGFGVIAAIAVLIVFARSGDSATSPTTSNTTIRPAQPAYAAAATTSKESGARSTQNGTETRPVTRASEVRLRLTAARAESWVEIRAGSAQGDVLFVGIMGEGAARSFRAPRLYVRLGNASGLDARLNDAPLQLPPGTYSALITPRGLESVSID